MTTQIKKIPKTAFQFLARADINPGDGERTLTGIAYSGDLITDHGYWSRLVIDLANLSIATPIPLLYSHDHNNSVGMVTNANTQQGKLAIDARLFADSDTQAADIAAKSDKGFPWQLSVGIWPDSIEEVQPNQKINVNGREFTGPITVFKNGRIREISVVSLGADHQTSATVLGAGDSIDIPFITHEVNTMTIEEAQAKIAELEAEIVQFKAKTIELSAMQPDPDKFVPITVMTALQTELATLSAAVNADKVSGLIKQALADGRLLPPQKDWAESLGKQNFDALSQFLNTVTPIAALLEAQTHGKPPAGADPLPATAEELAVAKQLGMSHDELIKHRSNNP